MHRLRHFSIWAWDGDWTERMALDGYPHAPFLGCTSAAVLGAAQSLRPGISPVGIVAL